MKRIVTIVVVLLVLIGGSLALRARLATVEPAEETKYKVAAVEVGTVRKTVSATGTIQPYSTVMVKSKAGGTVTLMKVDVGTRVKKGDIICYIDPSDTQLAVDQAQADIDAANSREASAEQTWRLQKQQSRLAVQTAEANRAAAAASVDAAQARLQTADSQRKAQPELTKASIESARANWENAQKQLDQLRDATNPQQLAAARSALDQATANLTNAESNLTRQKTLLAKGFVAQQAVDQALAARDVARAQVAEAQRKIDTIDREQKAALDAARAREAQARAQYENAKAQAVDVAVREQAYLEARASLLQARQQLLSADKALALAKAQVANDAIRFQDILNARASRARAQASLTNATTTLRQTIVRSPCDGVVLKKDVDQGTIISSALSFAASGNDIVQVADTTKLYVDVTVDETDLANVDVGQDVDVTLDAYPSFPIEGKVARIDPQALLENNVTDVHVRVELDSETPAFRLLKPGMNATCEFVKDKKDDVVKVPVEAIRTDDKGRFIELASGGKPAPPDPKTNTEADPSIKVGVKTTARYDPTDIEIGLEGNDSVEIKRGLKAGDMIVVQRIEPVKQQAGGAFGGLGPMRGGRR